MGKPVVHWEFWSKEPEKISNFYSKVFDWKIENMPEMNYRIVTTGGEGGINGGIMKPQHEEPWPGKMAFYIDVDNLGSTSRRSKKPAAKSTWKGRKCLVWAHLLCSRIPMAASMASGLRRKSKTFAMPIRIQRNRPCHFATP